MTWLSDPSTVGFYSGLFIGVFSTSGIIGNLMAGSLLQHVETQTVLWTFVGIAFFSVICLAFIQPVSRPSNEVDKTVKERFFSVFKASVDPYMRLLLLYMFYQGFSSSSIYSFYIQYITFEYIPFFMAIYSASLTIGGFVYGIFLPLKLSQILFIYKS